MGRRSLAAAAAAVAALASGFAQSEPALAHGERDPALRAVVDRVTPPLPGVRLSVVAATASQLSLENRGATPVEVLDGRGRPFLRIERRGVSADLASRTWYASGNPDGVARIPRSARGRGPRWRRVSDEPRWAWFDHRLHPEVVAAPPQVVQAGRPARLRDWRVPLRQGAHTAAVEGHVDYRPVRGRAVARLTSAKQVAPRLVVALLPGPVPGLYLVNSSKRTALVRGRRGEPFARVGPRGVEVNLQSLTWRDNELAKGHQVSALAAAGSPPDWRRLSRAQSFGWLETRARYPREQPAGPVLRRTGPTLLMRWSVPVEVGGVARPIAGRTDWVPFAMTSTGVPARTAPGGDASWWLAAGALGTALLAGLALRARHAAQR